MLVRNMQQLFPIAPTVLATANAIKEQPLHSGEHAMIVGPFSRRCHQCISIVLLEAKVSCHCYALI